MPEYNFNIQGLSAEQVLKSREDFGYNPINHSRENSLFLAVKGVLLEPMVIILLVASSIYFLMGKTGDGIFMTVAIFLVAAISVFQNSRSNNALKDLKNLTEPNCTVIRDGLSVSLKSESLVIGDCMKVTEGISIAADACIIYSNDFSINESVLTGESIPVNKDKETEDHYIYAGTTVASGMAIAVVSAIGINTKLGRIGESLEDIKQEKTPLELQINSFVKKMVIAGLVIFILVWGINFYHTHLTLDSLLKALTLAMSILPEEIPVAFATFMALGAWRLMKMGIVVKQMKTVETLGSATVICTDKTGTLTENKMSLAKLFVLASDKCLIPGEKLETAEAELLRLAMWASEPIPFDPMELALHKAYEKYFPVDERQKYKMVHEYPLSGKPPMMTHLFENRDGNRIIAAKGAPEALIEVSNLTHAEKLSIEIAINSLASDGYRLLAVAETHFNGNQFPVTQQQLKFIFKGLVAFYDPPKKNIPSVLQSFYAAGIDIKIVTGDNEATTKSIAKQIGLRDFENSISGDTLMTLTEEELNSVVMNTHVFTRMFPEAKLKIINALKANHQIVAMTGDGVNDGPALKAAHIGIAMGKKGTEIAKQAASLILVDDDLSKMVDAVAMGRRIYTNLKKAIRYIISVHIPIILTVFMPLALGWIYPNIFSPIHIIFLELIMGPTCSIVYENEPIEINSMLQKPRPFTNKFFNCQELMTSALQGLVIGAGSLLTYQYSIHQQFNEAQTRTMLFTVLIVSNIFLTLANRSFYYSIFTTFRFKNNLVLLIITVTLLITGLLIYFPPLTRFLKFESLTVLQLGIATGMGFISVIWYEGVKWKIRNSKEIE